MPFVDFEGCCPDPDPEDAVLDEHDLSNIIQRHGYDPRSTPIDTLMAAPFAMHAEVAHALNYGG